MWGAAGEQGHLWFVMCLIFAGSFYSKLTDAWSGRSVSITDLHLDLYIYIYIKRRALKLFIKVIFYKGGIRSKCVNRSPKRAVWWCWEWACNVFCPLGKHWLCACYQPMACFCDWGLPACLPACLCRKRENPADATSPPFTPSFVKLPPSAAAKSFSSTISQSPVDTFPFLKTENTWFLAYDRKKC